MKFDPESGELKSSTTVYPCGGCYGQNSYIELENDNIAGDGICSFCTGDGTAYNSREGEYLTCHRCKGNGVCPGCRGTGIVKL